jgi:hypothetical protein
MSVNIKALRDGHFDFGRDRDWMNLKNCGFGTGSVGMGFSWDCFGMFGITIKKIKIILRLLSTMMC